jgi:transposase
MAAPRKTDAKVDKQVAKAYAKGDSVASIGETFGLSAGTIRDIVKRTGGTLRPVGRPKTKA